MADENRIDALLTGDVKTRAHGKASEAVGTAQNAFGFAMDQRTSGAASSRR